MRSASPDDAATIAGLLGQLGYPTDDVAGLAGWLAAPPMAVRVAVAGDEVVGVATLSVIPLIHRSEPVGRISSMVVTEARRGRGVGRLLVDDLERLARAAGCARMEVTSNLRREDAHAFYERLGYERTSARFVKDF